MQTNSIKKLFLGAVASVILPTTLFAQGAPKPNILVIWRGHIRYIITNSA